VIDHVDKADNFYLLSGLLIGDELSYLLKRDDRVFLAASAQVLALYQQALEVLIDADRVSSVSADDFARALLIGQKKILELNEK
jgi:2-dehydro-3-deoxygalactonokinase